MNKSHLLGALCACTISCISLPAYSVGVSGQGTWESTLLPRDLDGDRTTAEAYFDITLGITWAAEADIERTTYSYWAEAYTYVTSLDIHGVTGWRLPAASPLNGATLPWTQTNNATSDRGYAPTTTDGSDGGWRNAAGEQIDEMGHMYYVTLGNLVRCTPDNDNPTSCTEQQGWSSSNTGPFINLFQQWFWGWTEMYTGGTSGAGYYNCFVFWDGFKASCAADGQDESHVWAVHGGDVGQALIPIPPTLWLFGSGLLGLFGVATRKNASK